MSNLVATVTDPKSPAAEAFRTLRTNLVFSSLDMPLQTLMVTAPTQDADSANKSITIANLAATMAQSGTKTLLVDCDLRRPHQHEIWTVANDKGITTTLIHGGDLPLTDVGIENLTVLTSGPEPSNPADLLGSHKMERLIQSMREKADLVLFDAPPLLAVTDAALLASKLDGILLVLSAGKTRRDHAAQAKQLLDRVNIRIVGAVLNNATLDARVGSY